MDNNNPRPAPQVVAEFHTNSDVDSEKDAQHHTIGTGVSQAASGAHKHDGNDSFQLLADVEIIGAKGGNTALASVIAALVGMGAKDSTT
jgi:hypothetical protein